AIPRGGEITRAAMLSRVEKIPLGTTIGSVVAERVTDLICMGLVILLALGVQYDIIIEFFESSKSGGADGNGKSWLFIVLGVLAVLGIAFLALRKRLNHIKLVARINELFQSFVDGIKGLTRIRKPLA